MSPTLFTRMSMRPKCANASAAMRATSSQTAMSPWTVIASPPSSRTRAAVSSAPGGRVAVVDRDARSLACEPLGDRDAEPASGPGDQGDLPFEPTAHASSS